MLSPVIIAHQRIPDENFFGIDTRFTHIRGFIIGSSSSVLIYLNLICNERK